MNRSLEYLESQISACHWHWHTTIVNWHLAELGLEEVPAEGAGGVVGGGEPLVEAGGVELLLAGPAAQLGQLVVGAVQDVEADVALLEMGEFRVLC